MSKINVGVIGVGQMGTYHAQIYQKLPQEIGRAHV